MKQFVISNYAKVFRKYSRKFSSDEKCLNTLFELVTDPLSYDDEKYADFHLGKSEVSDIINRKTNVPSIIQEGIRKIDFSMLMDGFADLLKDVEESKINILKKEIRMLYIEDKFPDRNLLDDKLKDDLEFMSLTFYYCTLNENKYHFSRVIWKKGNASLVSQAGNILSLSFDKRNMKQDKIIVIPVDSNFTMDLDGLSENSGKLISPKTIHGKWIIKAGKNDIKEKVKSYLESNNVEKTIGSIIPFKMGNTVFYLLAISTFDEKKNAHAKKEDLILSIESLLTFYDENGQGYPMYIPLIGTGMSRVGLSHKESFELLKDICLKNKNKITGTVYIMPYINDYKEMGDLNDVL